MIDLFLSGCCGRMGQVITTIVKERTDCRIVGGLDLKTKADIGYPVYTDVQAVDINFDVIIDFSNAKAVDSVLELACRLKKPLVLATTGLSEEQVKKVETVATQIPVFTSANMSLGINVLIHLAKEAVRSLYPRFNIEIIEAHHNQKLDAPSGTALMIADQIKASLPAEDEVFYRYERESFRAKRADNEIGISSIRGGTIVGEHDVLLAGPNETITLSHSAQSRDIFAEGALAAALFIAGLKPGHYHMDDLIQGKL